MNLACPRRRPTLRAALTTTELLGCVVAVAGGLWIGAQYWKVDLHKAAYQALDESTLLEKIPDDWRPANPDCPNGDCPDPAAVRAAIEAELRAELTTLRLEATRLTNVADDSADPATLSAEQIEQRDRTIAFWQQLAEVITDVGALESRVVPLRNTADQPRVFAVRRRALAYGRRAIEHLDTAGVDPQAAEAAVRVADWYTEGETLFEQATELTGRQPVDGRAVSASRLLGQSEQDHAKRSELLRRKLEEVASVLHGRYLVEFPPLPL